MYNFYIRLQTKNVRSVMFHVYTESFINMHSTNLFSCSIGNFELLKILQVYN